MMGDLKGKNERIPIYTVKATFYPGTDFLLTEDLQKINISSSWMFLRYKYPLYYTIMYLPFIKAYCILDVFDDKSKKVVNNNYRELLKKVL